MFALEVQGGCLGGQLKRQDEAGRGGGVCGVVWFVWCFVCVLWVFGLCGCWFLQPGGGL